VQHTAVRVDKFARLIVTVHLIAYSSAPQECDERLNIGRFRQPDRGGPKMAATDRFALRCTFHQFSSYGKL